MQFVQGNFRLHFTYKFRGQQLLEKQWRSTQVSIQEFHHGVVTFAATPIGGISPRMAIGMS